MSIRCRVVRYSVSSLLRGSDLRCLLILMNLVLQRADLFDRLITALLELLDRQAHALGIRLHLGNFGLQLTILVIGFRDLRF